MEALELGSRKLAIKTQRVDGQIPAKAKPGDFIGRFREIVSDPVNVLIERHPLAGVIDAEGLVTLHNGVKVPVAGSGAYYTQFSYILGLNRGVHEPLEEYTFQELLKVLPDAPSMIELGAYWGHYSMWLKTRRPEASVILVEAERSLLDIGEQNFRRNGLKGEFMVGFVNRGQFEVDRFLQERGIDHLTILHSDIQGYEGVMMTGAQETLAAKRVDYVFVSTHADNLHQRVTSALRAADYRIEVSSDFERHTTSYDGFIFASSPRVAPVLPGFKPLGRTEIATASPSLILERLSSAFRATTA